MVNNYNFASSIVFYRLSYKTSNSNRYTAIAPSNLLLVFLRKNSKDIHFYKNGQLSTKTKLKSYGNDVSSIFAVPSVE